MNLPTPPRRFIGVFLLAMLNLAVMASLRNLPLVAEYGFQSALFYLFVALVFLLPVAFISAELATGWAQEGGIYAWVREAFGPKWGFFAVWMQWVHNVTWFPAILSFSAAAIAYVVHPPLAANKWYVLAVILIGFWGFTLFNYFGLKTSSWFSAIGVIAGTIIPGVLLIALGTIWIASGDPLQIHFNWESLLPSTFEIKHLVFLTGLFLAFGGLEVSAVHAKDVEHPQRIYPKAILIAASFAFVLYVLGALAIAIMIPGKQISLVSSLLEAFELFLSHFHLSWLVVPLSLMILLGAVGELNAWIIGPVRALHATAYHGDLPPIFQKLNAHNIPFNLLLFQGGIVTLSSFVFLFMPTTSSAFWILSAMSAQLYLLMYIAMFLTGIKLRYSKPNVFRAFRVPFGDLGIWFFGLLGVFSSLLAFFMGFIPPAQIPVGNLIFYEGFLMGGIALMCFIPLLIFFFRHPGWHPDQTPPKK